MKLFKKLKMAKCCDNPLKIKRHHRSAYAYEQTSIIDQVFCETYLTVCNNLTEGKTVCSKCREKIISSKSADSKCLGVDPFSQGPHSLTKYLTVSKIPNGNFFPSDTNFQLELKYVKTVLCN